jgi:hypothetical protein
MRSELWTVSECWASVVSLVIESKKAVFRNSKTKIDDSRAEPDHKSSVAKAPSQMR